MRKSEAELILLFSMVVMVESTRGMVATKNALICPYSVSNFLLFLFDEDVLLLVSTISTILLYVLFIRQFFFFFIEEMEMRKRKKTLHIGGAVAAW